MKVVDGLGREEIVSQEIYNMVRNATPRYKLQIDDLLKSTSFVSLRMRQTDCLEINCHEPRPWIVCFQDTYGKLARISFHRTLGGVGGALHQAGVLIGEYQAT